MELFLSVQCGQNLVDHSLLCNLRVININNMQFSRRLQDIAFKGLLRCSGKTHTLGLMYIGCV